MLLSACATSPIEEPITTLPTKNLSLIEQYELGKASIKDLSANFIQKKIFTLFEEETLSSGKVYYQKPQQVIWSYEKPSQTKTLMKGDKAWAFFPDAQQIQQVSIGGASADRIFQILGLGNSKNKLEDSFLIKTLSDQKEGSYQFILTPQDKTLTPFYTEITLHLSQDNFFPNHIILKETSGDITEIMFSKTKINSGLNSSLFDLEIPRGYELINMSE